MDHFFTENSENEIVWDGDKLTTFVKDKNTRQVIYFARTNRSVSILRYKKYHISGIFFEIEHYDYFTITENFKDVQDGNCCHLCGSIRAKLLFRHIGYECYMCHVCYQTRQQNCKSRRLIKTDTGGSIYILDEKFNPNHPYSKRRDVVVNQKYIFDRLTLNIDNYHPSYLSNEYSNGRNLCIRCNTDLIYDYNISNIFGSKSECIKCINYGIHIYKDMYFPKFELLFKIQLEDVHQYIALIFIDICNNTKFGNTSTPLIKHSRPKYHKLLGDYGSIMEQKVPL